MSDQTRLLVVCPSLEVGGAERQLSVLIPALGTRGFEPSVVTIRERGRFFDELSAAGVSIRFLEVRTRFDQRGIRRALAAVGTWPDIVMSQSLDAQLVGWLIARRADAPHLTVHHGGPDLVSSLHRRWLTRFVASRVDRVIAVSESQRAHLVGAGFPAARIAVVANGVDEPPATRSRADVRSELGFDADDFVAVLAATLRPEKRASVFLDAVTRANDTDPSIRGIVAGQGPDLRAITAKASGQGVVKVLGERSDLGDLIAASDVVCLTSDAEAAPMVILEAMALAKPVIATAVGGIPEVVVHERTGLLTPVDRGQSLATALVTLSANRATATAMGAAGRARYEARFSAESMADHYATALRELLETRRG